MKNTIVKTYNRQRESDLVTTGYRILEKLEGNQNFPNPPESLARLKVLLPEYQLALVNAKGREKEAISLKNDKKAQLLSYIEDLAQFAMTVGNGDRTLLLSSGFDVYGTRIQQTLPFIEKLEVELGPPGEATTRVKRMARIRAYLHQHIAEVPTSDSTWINEVSTQPVHTFKGLRSGSQYWFRVSAVHANGDKLHSPVLQRIIQ